MPQYYSQNVTIRRNAAFQYLAAWVEAGFVAMSRRQSGLREGALVDDDRNRELQQISRQQYGASPRGLFDPLFSGLSADAAGIDAAICRRLTRLR
jgi:hypothetical protein